MHAHETARICPQCRCHPIFGEQRVCPDCAKVLEQERQARRFRYAMNLQALQDANRHLYEH